MQFSIVTLMLLEEQMNNENTATMVTVKMLKEACRARGLKISRKTKEELVQMLHADLTKEQVLSIISTISANKGYENEYTEEGKLESPGTPFQAS